MKKLATWGGVWIVVTVVAVGVSWQGVELVGNQVTDERPASLTAGEIDALVGDSSTSTTSTSTTVFEDDDTGRRGDGTVDDDGAGPTTTLRSPTSTVRSGVTTTTTAAASPSGDSAPAETRTYNLTGGSAALRFSPSGVTVVWANPNAGFEVEVEPEHINGVKVEFRSETHRSRVDGWWDNGPQDRIREIPEN